MTLSLSYHGHSIQLFHEGRLGEAILALEAEVQRNPNNSDAWRWLGTAHAENDEDKVAVIALQRSLTADPENIEALFDGGVSHTNELTTQMVRHRTASARAQSVELTWLGE